MLGQQITVAALVSLLVSSIFGIITFAVGIRVGKERSDRAAMRDLYRRLYDHFSEIGRRLEKGEPKQWSDYPVIAEKRCPAVRALEETGDIHLLPRHLADKLLGTERRALRAGYEFHQRIVNDVNIAVKKVLEGTAKPLPRMQPYTTVTIGTLLLRGNPTLAKLPELLSTGKINGIALGGPTADGKVWTHYLDAEDGNAALSLIGAVYDAAIMVSRTEIDEIKSSIIAVNEALTDLGPRIRDPHPFSETVFSVGRDIFDQSSR